ncbi:Uncharacterised protein [Mycobacteroides abscessus subsp. massiliense]|nr:Uncharacterised protein [Mycobacteroides abscessus subsp. massiliense]
MGADHRRVGLVCLGLVAHTGFIGRYRTVEMRPVRYQSVDHGRRLLLQIDDVPQGVSQTVQTRRHLSEFIGHRIGRRIVGLQKVIRGFGALALPQADQPLQLSVLAFRGRLHGGCRVLEQFQVPAKRVQVHAGIHVVPVEQLALIGCQVRIGDRDGRLAIAADRGGDIVLRVGDGLQPLATQRLDIPLVSHRRLSPSPLSCSPARHIAARSHGVVRRLRCWRDASPRDGSPLRVIRF